MVVKKSSCTNTSHQSVTLINEWNVTALVTISKVSILLIRKQLNDYQMEDPFN